MFQLSAIFVKKNNIWEIVQSIPAICFTFLKLQYGEVEVLLDLLSAERFFIQFWTEWSEHCPLFSGLITCKSQNYNGTRNNDFLNTGALLTKLSPLSRLGRRLLIDCNILRGMLLNLNVEVTELWQLCTTPAVWRFYYFRVCHVLIHSSGLFILQDFFKSTSDLLLIENTNCR